MRMAATQGKLLAKMIALPAAQCLAVVVSIVAGRVVRVADRASLSPGPLRPPALTHATAAAKASAEISPTEATRKLFREDPFTQREEELAVALQQRLELTTAEVVRLLMRHPQVNLAALFSHHQTV